MRIRATILLACLLVMVAGGIARAQEPEASTTPSPSPSEELAPEYVSSEPADGEVLHKAPEEVVVRFSEPLDESSVLTVRDECGKRVDHGTEISMNEMSAGLHSSYSGKYTVTYEAHGFGNITGTTTGRFTFTVHMGKSCDGKDDDDSHNHGNGNGNGGNDHGRHGSGGNDGGGHEKHGGGDGSHQQDPSTGHSAAHDPQAGHTPSHSGGGHEGTAHGGRNKRHAQHRQHGKGGGRHDKHQITPTDPNGSEHPPLASGKVPKSLRPDEQTVLVALGLSLALGTAGGLFLRFSSAL